MKNYVLALGMIITLCQGCMSFPLVKFEFGPLVTVKIGEQKTHTETNAYGEAVAKQVIEQATEAIEVKIPNKSRKTVRELMGE
jgi:hypothetical protein